MEKRFLHKDGRTIWGDLSISLVRDSEMAPLVQRSKLAEDNAREIMYAIALVRNTTEDKRAQEALQGSEELYRTTIDSMRDMIFVVNRDLRIALVNAAFTRYCEEMDIDGDVIDKTIPEAFPSFPMSVLNEYTQILASREAKVQSIRLVVSDKEYAIEITRIPILTGDRVTQVLTIMRRL